MTIDDIKKSLSKMTTDELQTLVAGIRQSRQTHKAISYKVEDRPTKKAEKSKGALAALLGDMSDAQKEEIIKALGGEL